MLSELVMQPDAPGTNDAKLKVRGRAVVILQDKFNLMCTVLCCS